METEFEGKLMRMLVESEARTEGRLVKLETSIGGFDTRLSEIQNALKENSKEGSWRSQIPVILALVSLVGLLLLPVKEGLETLKIDFRDHKNNHGHTVMIEEMAGVRADILNLKTREAVFEDELLRLRDKVEDHQGHPHKVIGMVDALADRFRSIEGTVDGITKNRWDSDDGMENRERIALLEAKIDRDFNYRMHTGRD